MDIKLPWIIQGTVYDRSGNTKSSTLTLTNENTGDTLTLTTSSNGIYVFDLANLESGYSNNNIIKIEADGTGTRGTDLRLKIIARDSITLKKIKLRYNKE